MTNKVAARMDEGIINEEERKYTLSIDFINHLHYELHFVAGVLDLVYASSESEVHLTDKARFVIIDAGSRVQKLIEAL